MLTLISATYDWIYDDNSWVLSSKGLSDSLYFLHEIYQKNKILDNVSISIMQGKHTTDTIARKLLAEEIGIALYSNRLGAAIVRNSYDDLDSKIGITPFPRQYGAGSTSVTRTWMFGISALSSQKFIGFEFLKALLSKDVQVLSSEQRGDFPVRRDATRVLMTKHSNSYIEEMSDYLYFSRFVPDGIEYPIVSKQLGLLCESIVNGSKTPDQGLNDFMYILDKTIPPEHRLYK